MSRGTKRGCVVVWPWLQDCFTFVSFVSWCSLILHRSAASSPDGGCSSACRCPSSPDCPTWKCGFQFCCLQLCGGIKRKPQTVVFHTACAFIANNGIIWKEGVIQTTTIVPVCCCCILPLPPTFNAVVKKQNKQSLVRYFVINWFTLHFY